LPGVWRNAHVKDPVVATGCKYGRDLTCCKIQLFYAFEEGNIAGQRCACINQTACKVQARPGDWYGCSKRDWSCIIGAYFWRESWREVPSTWSRYCWPIKINGTTRQAKNYETIINRQREFYFHDCIFTDNLLGFNVKNLDADYAKKRRSILFKSAIVSVQNESHGLLRIKPYEASIMLRYPTQRASETTQFRDQHSQL